MAKSRGRPRQFDRDAALAAAARLFWSKGYEATSLSDLKQAMGIGSPSLYAAFHSKEALYVESLQYYRRTYDYLVWGNFAAAATAREAVRSFLMDSAAALTGHLADIPKGCMLVLSSVGSEGHDVLGEIVRSGRAATVERLEARFSQAILDGDLSDAVDLHALARLIQTVQAGMSILARDDVSFAELRAVAELAIEGWDAYLAKASRSPEQHDA
ncbi:MULTISPECIES: TetR/AcrR family transcriptional regulator [unclassified Devosia]|uniref:TetR/AcrR family transcriptional regulator n=1 Tax=unclassified Devosia TaxID=196773 RepID=UPI0020C019D4|nr:MULTISPECIES: TetR/AcrR family transcriptional regulator [unclassified Devosia]